MAIRKVQVGNAPAALNLRKKYIDERTKKMYQRNVNIKSCL